MGNYHGKMSAIWRELYEQVYHKVFFSRITLEDKLGQEYEPYIFAALNSARAAQKDAE